MPELRRADDGVRLVLEEYEAEILRRLADEMRLLLEADVPPEDRVVRRLFPAAYEEEGDEAAYRELVGGELKEAKSSALRAVTGALGREGECDVVVPRERLDEWLTFLTDTRLAIGTRLEVDEETMAEEVDASDPDAVALSILHWLGYVQQTILEFLMEE